MGREPFHYKSLPASAPKPLILLSVGALAGSRLSNPDHRLPQRIRAHAMLCFMEWIVLRVMRHLLNWAKSDMSPQQALAQLRRIQRHSVSIGRAAPMGGVSPVNSEQAKVLAAPRVTKPEANTQM